MNNIVYQNNFSYPATDLIGPNISTGINYFDGNWKPCSHNTFSASVTGGYSNDANVVDPLNQSKVLLFHVYGTIKKYITDSISFYHISETASLNDPTIIIPANIYSDTDYVDWTYIQTNDYTNYNQFRMFIVPCDNSYKVLDTAKYTLNFNVDVYSL